MRFITIFLYDLKRLFGHGRTAVFAILLPVPVMLLFSTFFVPMLSSEKGITVSCALFMEEDNERFVKAIDKILSAEEGKGTAVIYPVKDEETGMRLVEEGKVAVYIHVQERTYERLNNGEKVAFEYYYNSLHAMEAVTFARALQSTCSVFGQGVRVVKVGADLAINKGIDEETVLDYWHKGTEDIINLHTNRGRVLGWDGVFLPGGDFPIKYYVALLFAVCALFSILPGIYLTSQDINEIFPKRRLYDSDCIKYFFARLLSQTVLVMVVFCILYPTASAVDLIQLKNVMATIPAVILVSFCFSAFGILIGSISINSNMALWTGFYLGGALAMLAVLSSKEGLLPEIFASISRYTPVRAAVSIFSNGLYDMEIGRYGFDLIVLGVSSVIFVIPALLAYKRRGCGQ